VLGDPDLQGDWGKYIIEGSSFGRCKESEH
jgi:hypothetical protein